jgi:hypothetical protein
MNPLDEADHDAQAVTLEAASRDSVPFCAVCEKARLNRELNREGKGIYSSPHRVPLL